MKTTIDIPDQLFREAKALAALQGESLKSFVCRAIESQIGNSPRPPSWRDVFGKVRKATVSEVDAVVALELGVIDEDQWL